MYRLSTKLIGVGNAIFGKSAAATIAVSMMMMMMMTMTMIAVGAFATASATDAVTGKTIGNAFYCG